MRRISLFILMWALICCAAWAQDPMQGTAPGKVVVNTAGKVELVEGDVTVYDRAKAARKVRIRDPLYEGERIVTGRNGELHLSMDDGGYLAVRPNTNMNIQSFQAQGRDDDRSILNLIAGSFRSITGWIGKHDPKSYQVRTPTATIGIRGTDHEPLVVPEGAKDAEPGTYDKVNAGGTVIVSNRGHGRIEVTPNRAGFAPLRGKPTPRLLSRVPRFYRPTRNESRLAHKHRAVQKAVDRLRDERKRVILERSKRSHKPRDTRKAPLERGHQQPRKEREHRRELHKDQRMRHTDERKHEIEGRKQKSEARRRARENRRDAPRGRNRN
jgi:hypothetical protein